MQRVDFPLGNWGEINAVVGGALTPTAQTSSALTNIAGLSLVSGFTGLFEVYARLNFADGTTAGATVLRVIAKQGATTGAIAGGLAAAKFGGAAASVAVASGATANGMILNADAAGGGGLTFEGASANAAAAIASDTIPSLTGLLSAQGSGASAFAFAGVADAAPSSAVKTPFTLGKPVYFAFVLSSTAAHVITFSSLNLFVRELPVA